MASSKRFNWTQARKARLLRCTTREQMLKAFPIYAASTLMRYRRRFRQELEQPERKSFPMDKDTTAGAPAEDVGLSKTEQVQALLEGAEAVDSAGDVANATNAAERVDIATAGKVAELFAANGIDPATVEGIDKVRIGTYQMITKNNDGEAEMHELSVASMVLTPAKTGAKSGPAWPVVQVADPVTIKATKLPRRKQRKFSVTVVLPDPQIGYRQLKEGLDPFHDEDAMSVALRIMASVDPDTVVNLGDFLDLPSFGSGKFPMEPSFALCTQAAVNRGHRFLVEQKAGAPRAHIVLLEGNHDKRMPNNIIANAAAAFGITQAAPKPEDWPVMTVPHLLRVNELGVEYVDGWPAGQWKVNRNLKCIHGRITGARGTVQRKILAQERVSVITGHTHGYEDGMATAGDDEDRPKVRRALTLGCLCRIDGAVPSTRGAIDSHGRPVKQIENWQQMMAVVVHDEERFAIEPILIHEGVAIFRDRLFWAESLDEQYAAEGLAA